MSARARLVAWLNVGWMFLLWGTRLRNAVRGDGPDAATALTYVVVASSLLAATVLAGVAWRGGPAVLARLIVSAHAVLWVVRGVQIAMGDHDLAFVVVHEVLAAVSVGLAGWLLTVTGGFRPGDRASLRSAPLWDSP